MGSQGRRGRSVTPHEREWTLHLTLRCFHGMHTCVGCGRGNAKSRAHSLLAEEVMI